MDWFRYIRMYYKMGYWTKDMVKVAVVANKITPEQYKEITGDEYVPNEETV